MSGWMDKTKDERRMLLAVMLGFHDGSPHTWPDGVINNILSDAEKLADMHIQDEVQFYGPRYMATPPK